MVVVAFLAIQSMVQFAEQIRFCKSRDGTRIAYGVCGSGPPLLFAQYWIHHLKLDWDSPIWRPWLTLLAKRHTLVRFDWRGCGLSDREPVNDFSLDRHIEDLEAVATAAGFDSYALFGMAGGATLAIRYAVEHQDQIERLILYGSQTRGRMARGMTPEQREEAETRLKVISIGWPNETPAFGQFYTALHMPDAAPEQMRAFDDLVRRTTSPATTVKKLRSYWEADVFDIVSQVSCPSLVLHAREDSIIPFVEGRLVASMIPDASFVPLESRNHLLLEGEAAWGQFVEAVDGFLFAGPAQPSTRSLQTLGDLSARENEVLELVARGFNNTAIGTALGISERTARNHFSAILSKLGLNSRAQAIVVAREAGFGKKMTK
jgi:pimeloyl-ACP methyl ester carboxylesterase/DNA-binding CsgD family transcriptional regulator